MFMHKQIMQGVLLLKEIYNYVLTDQSHYRTFRNINEEESEEAYVTKNC